ncbi:MAG: carboxypeptidase regulatory-like domain-containing protein [Verrucomicrobia subdivision 3 bacterium]|nr:carboxypeptidase regulatory-like domain-containing protein [Limisphaerales bacterium]
MIARDCVEAVTCRNAWLFRFIVFVVIGTVAQQAVFAQSAEAKVGTIEGTVSFVGEIPKSTVADDAGVRHDLVEVDGRTRGLRYVVVYLTRTDGAKLSGERAASSSHSSDKLLMDQVDYAFRPRVLTVQEGELVTFTNSDPANHNVRTIARNKTNKFNVFTGVDGKYEHRFGVEPEQRPIRLGCDIHPWMQAWIYVFDHPFFAVTDATGQFRIPAVPTGKYGLHIVQPDIRHSEQRQVSISEGETAKVDFVVRRDGTKQH